VGASWGFQEKYFHVIQSRFIAPLYTPNI